MTNPTTHVERQLTAVPLSALVRSDRNVRKAGSGVQHAQSIETLARSILVNGVLQNLLVHPERKRNKPTGRYAVVAGARRLEALQWLQQHGDIAPDYLVPVSVGTASEATVVSLTENTHREAMHPADELEAFMTLAGQGLDVAEIATRFGYAELTVRRRLKLAALSPRLLALYRENAIALDQLMALTLSDDHAAQEQAWFGSAEWNRSPASLRRLLTREDVNLKTDPVARLVGLAAYQQAGGAIRRDLFDPDSVYLLDAGLVTRLAQARLEAVAVPLRDACWKWVEVLPAYDNSATLALRTVPPARRAPGPLEQVQLDTLTAALSALEDAYQDNEDEDSAAAYRAYQAQRAPLDAEVEAIEAELRDWSDEVRACAGVLVTISHQGEVLVRCGLVRPEDARIAAQALRVGANSEEGSHAAQPKADLSERLMRELTAYRTAAIQLAVLQQPSSALALLAHRLVTALFMERYMPLVVTRICQISASDTRHALAEAAAALPESRAGQLFAIERERWLAALPVDPAALLPWLLAQPVSVLTDLLAFCCASTVDTISASNEVPADTRALQHALQVDMADWWQPTAKRFFMQVPKARGLAAVHEALPHIDTTALASLKKEAFAQEAERLMADTRWLPQILRS